MPAQEDELGVRVAGADHRRRAPVSDAFLLAAARGREAKSTTPRDRGKEIAQVARRLANRSTEGESGLEQ